MSQTVRGFAKLSSKKLASLKSQLGLTMSQEILETCTKYYRFCEPKQDPFREELLFLDRLVSLPAPAHTLPLSDLYTNDSFVAETYADMMKKRRELRPNAKHPITPIEALRLATDYLERAGKTATTAAPITLACRTRKAFGGRIGEIYADGSDFSLCTLDPSGETKPQVGDRFILVYRGSMPTWKYREEIGGFLSRESVRRASRMIRTVPECGVLSMLLLTHNGLAINLTESLPDGTDPSLLSIGNRFAGYACILAPKSAAKELEEQIRACGMRPYTVATVTDGERTEFVFPQNQTLSFRTDFLRHLTVSKPQVARLPGEDSAPVARVSGLASAKASAYLRGLQSKERLTLDAFTATAATAESASPFRSALQATVSAVLSAASAGMKNEEMRLAIGVKYPGTDQSAEQIGALMSGILGIYRAQTELAIPATCVAFEEDESLSSPEFTVFCLGKCKEIPNEAAKEGGKLFCVSPAVQDNGLPCFDSLRQLLGKLSEQAESGRITGAYTVCNQTLTDALRVYAGKATLCRTDNRQILSDEKLPLAVLLQSDSALPYVEIGSVESKEAEACEADVWIEGDLNSCLNRGETTEVVLVARPTDADAHALADYVTSLGARATVLSPNAPALVHAILRAQMVLFCRGIEEPEDPRVCFACEAMDLAGGILLSLDPSLSFDEEFPILTLEGGLSAENLQSLLGL